MVCEKCKKIFERIMDEEVSRPESRKGMVGWTIPSFHQFIDSECLYDKERLKTSCTIFLHQNGERVDVAEYHDRVLERLIKKG